MCKQHRGRVSGERAGGAPAAVSPGFGGRGQPLLMLLERDQVGCDLLEEGDEKREGKGRR